jgi:type I restriction enzyme S subunit
MTFPRYPNYQDSGVQWLGSMPRQWKVVQFKQFVDIQNGSDHKHVEQPEGYPVIGSGGVFAYASDFLYDGESVLLGRKGTVDKPLHVSGRFWTVDTMYWTKISPNVSGRFTYYLALTIPFGYYSTNTALPSMTKASLKSHLVPCPTLAEQTHIASFLDWETAKLDELAAEQQRLMEVLKEKRKAVIFRAVTKGLNADAPLKPSGIEWLGDVPKHWDLTKIKWVARMESGHTPDRKVAEYWQDGSIPWVSLNDTGYLKENDYISDTALKVTGSGIANSSARILPPRTVVFSRDATIGRCAITTRPMAVSQHFIAWVCSTSLVPEFLLFCLRSMTHELERRTTGATLKTIGMPEVKTLVIPVPPVEEQQAIVDHVTTETNKVDSLVGEAQRAIDLLQERRTALIAAAVTGHIDIRALAKSEAAA